MLVWYRWEGTRRGQEQSTTTLVCGSATGLTRGKVREELRARKEGTRRQRDFINKDRIDIKGYIVPCSSWSGSPYSYRPATTSWNSPLSTLFIQMKRHMYRLSARSGGIHEESGSASALAD